MLLMRILGAEGSCLVGYPHFIFRQLYSVTPVCRSVVRLWGISLKEVDERFSNHQDSLPFPSRNSSTWYISLCEVSRGLHNNIDRDDFVEYLNAFSEGDFSRLKESPTPSYRSA